MIKSTSELKHTTDPMPTPDTWSDFVNEQFGSFGPFCYVDATFNFLQKLEPILALNDFNEMKDKLTDLYQERYAFVAFADKHSP